ncbi:hypothetical protein [Parapedobacter sp. DT-150]|uniref:hypothetical protein n=1 Tax=Parapedobacter sp. DT-150 TaxID=3396162 RepID=UPI003F1AEEDA
MQAIKTMPKDDIISLSRKWLGILLYFAIAIELIVFPSWENLCGCIMELIVWAIFRTYFLKRSIILMHPFAFLMFLSMFLYRYIPLIATLIEGKPIAYEFGMAYETFFHETLLFIVSSLAFYTAVVQKKKSNNAIQRALYKLGFFETDARILWLLGLVGLAIRVQQLSVAGEVEYGDVGNKLLAGLTYLQYAPLIMLFPTLSGIAYNRRRNIFIWVYVVVLFLVSFATNSRLAMLFPILTIILLYFLFLLKHNISIFRHFSLIRIVVLGIVIVFGLNLVSDISLAMLATRGVRGNVGRFELFNKTIETLQNEELMQRLRSVSLEEKNEVISYNEGWDEMYLDNFMLNRFGNLRISDRTIYYADKIGYGNKVMLDDFTQKALATYPTSILNLLGIQIDKTKLEYSRGDMLYQIVDGKSLLGSFRVTSHVGDGLATFGYLYFLIQYIFFFLVFKLLDCYVWYGSQGIVYSTLGLINVFGFLGMFRNANGCLTDLSYIMRGFWQDCFTFWIVIFVLKIFIRSK